MITDRTQQDVDSGTSKGFYNALDLNRVEAKVAELAEIFDQLGYATSPVTRLDWGMSDIPNSDDLQRYFTNIATIRNILVAMDTTPSPPMVGAEGYAWEPFTFDLANHAEEILEDVETLLTSLQQAFCHTGTTICGVIGVIA